MHRLLPLLVAAVSAVACSWDYPIWIPRTKTADPLYRFIKNGKAGYIDAQGKIVVPPTLPAFGNYASEFHNGLLHVSVSDAKYVDTTGKLALNPDLHGWHFSEGLAAAMREGEKLWGYIDTSGKFAVSPRFPTYPEGSVYSFSEGMAAIDVKGRFGFIDRSGTFVIPPRFLDASSFANGLARVVVDGPCVYIPEGPCGIANPRYPGVPKSARPGAPVAQTPCKFTYIDRSGRIITAQRFDYGRDFSEGLAPVQQGRLWGFIDRTGALVISPRFEDAEPFSSGLTRIHEKGQYGYADKSGRVVIEPQFKEAESFSEGLAVVGDGDGRFWYINPQGQAAFRGKFARASPFFKGLAHVQLAAKGAEEFEYIDPRGRVVFRYRASE